jgi:hypothetical protein
MGIADINRRSAVGVALGRRGGAGSQSRFDDGDVVGFRCREAVRAGCAKRCEMPTQAGPGACLSP